MGKRNDQRDRTLSLAHILQEETDEHHPLPLADLVSRLAGQGLTAERKSIYRDIAALKKHGLDVVFRAGGDGGWYVESRSFDRKDLSAIVDAVAAYRWLPEEQREELIYKLIRMAPVHQRKSLRRPVALRRRSASAPEELRAALDKIHTALQGRKTLSFLPFTFDKGKARVFGARQVVTPKGLLWYREVYYLLAWDHKDGRLRLYRPDRMEKVQVTALPPQGPETDASLWDAFPFGLDPTRKEKLRLRCCQELAGEVLDHFGQQAILVPEGDKFSLTAEVVVGPEFWGWMAAHSDKANVIAPPWAVKLWADHYCPREPQKEPQTKTG